MNKVKEIANVFGLEIEERFNIREYYLDNPFYFDKDYGLVAADGLPHNSFLPDLMLGGVTIKKLPYKPKHGERYYYREKNGFYCWKDYDEGSTYDYLNVLIGNCFRTPEEAHKKGKEVFDKLEGFYNE